MKTILPGNVVPTHPERKNPDKAPERLQKACADFESIFLSGLVDMVLYFRFTEGIGEIKIYHRTGILPETLLVRFMSIGTNFGQSLLFDRLFGDDISFGQRCQKDLSRCVEKMGIAHQLAVQSVGFDQIKLFLLVNDKPPQWAKPKS